MRSLSLSDQRHVLAATGIALGAGLVGASWRLDRSWFDRHVLPDVFMPRQEQWHVAAAIRLGLLAAGLSLALLALLTGRLAPRGLPRHPWRTAGLVAAAILAALGTAECALRVWPWSPFQAWHLQREPRRDRDPLLGWKHLPGHAGRQTVGGRSIEFAFDNHGYRVAMPGRQTDLNARSVLFAGESIMLGYGLHWPESIPAHVQSQLGIQVADLAVTGYSIDQSFMRLRQDLPGFAHPDAIVVIYMPEFLDRDMNTDRPHLDAALHWHPPAPGLRLGAVLRHGLSLRSTPGIAAGIAQEAAILRATSALARSRCARLVVLAPVFQPEDRMAKTIRDQVMRAARSSPLLVPLDASWRIPGDLHPDARAARAMADALVARLRQSGSPPCRA